MARKKASPMAGILPRLWSTDMTPLIRVAGVMMPRVLDGFLASLDEKERRAIDRVMPPGGGKMMYVQLVGSPTPPIVVEMAQPLKVTTLPEGEVRAQEIRGIRLRCNDVVLLADGLNLRNILRLSWRLRGQWITTLRLLWTFMPLLRLGRSGMRDMQAKLNARLGPLLGLLGM